MFLIRTYWILIVHLLMVAIPRNVCPSVSTMHCPNSKCNDHVMNKNQSIPDFQFTLKIVLPKNKEQYHQCHIWLLVNLIFFLKFHVWYGENKKISRYRWKQCYLKKSFKNSCSKEEIKQTIFVCIQIYKSSLLPFISEFFKIQLSNVDFLFTL